MGIYLPNMEMPKETTLISIGPGGTVEIHRNDDLTWVPLKEKAVPVPPHGRMIDADAPISLIDTHGEKVEVTVAHIIEKNQGIVKAIIPESEKT